MKIYNKFLLCIALLTFFIAQSCMGLGGIRDYHEYQTYWVQPYDSDNEQDVKWADYLYDHFKNRISDPNLVAHRNENPHNKPVLKVKIGIDASMSHEFAIDTSYDEIVLKARRHDTALWLAYQFMAAASEGDARISDEELFPPIVEMKDTKGDFAFEYRGIYNPSNMDLDLIPIRASHNIDTDWGIWGHNLRKCFGGSVPAEAQALVDGVRNPEQLCFSSEKLYKAVERYIADNYGEEPDLAAKFMIMPDDNNLVCLCPECKKRGNTAFDASPAVISLAKHLAHRFPYHEFFITLYSTAKTVPNYRLPDNIGIMISAIDYPPSGQPDQMNGFETLINRCKKATDIVYIWEYGRNFDDYLTPFPCLSIMAERIKFYRDNGVRGIFINGSGYDYSTLNIMRSYVFSALMLNPEASVSDLMSRFLKLYYPTTHEIIFNYYDHIEQLAMKAPKGLSFYGGITDAKRAYLDPEEFERFFNKINGMVHSTEGQERKLLNKLLTGLCYTRLELMRCSEKMYDKSLTADPLATLADHSAFDDMENYREGYGSIDLYLKQWDKLDEIKPMVRSNLLKGRKLNIFSDLDQDYNDPESLTDGLVGFSTDYHTNWMINSQRTLDVEIPADCVKPGRKITVSALHAPRWRIGAPSVIQLKAGSNVIASATVAQPSEASRSLTSIAIPASAAGRKLHLRVDVAPGFPKFAIDEIILSDN